MKPVNFFHSGSPYLSHPLLTAERTAREIDFILVNIDLQSGARVLDVGCGPGRHSLELSRRGYQVVGIDPSAAMISAALSRANESEAMPEFIQVRGENFTTTLPFDASICLFTTLGQMADEQDNRRLVSNVYETLHPGGYFVVEVPNREWVKRNLKTNECFGDETHFTQMSRQYDPTRNIVEEAFRVVTPQDKQTYMLRYRLYNQVELHDLLHEAEFLIIDMYGGYDGKPLNEDSSVIIAFARKSIPLGV